MPTPVSAERPIQLAMLAAVATIALKAGASALTGSVGLFSEALESVVNLVTALIAYASLRYAARPADRDHAYGHAKIEFFSSGLEGVLVGLAGVGTVAYSVRQFFAPAELTRLDLGVPLALLAAAINAAVAWLQLRVGKRLDSPLLIAAGRHLWTDVLTSGAVVGGLVLVALTGETRLDALLAFGVGLHIVRTGVGLVRVSFDGLMDHALPAAEQEALRAELRAALPENTDFHLLRTRRAGRRRFADFHLLVAGSTTVRDAHKLAHAVEERLGHAVKNLEVTIHVEPIDEAASWEAQSLSELGEPAGPRLGGAE